MFVGSTQAAKLMGISARRIRQLLQEGRIQGAFKAGRSWIIPLVEGMPQVKEGTRGPLARWRRRKPSPVTIIHVNQQTIRQNQKQEKPAPVISVKRGQENIYGHEVEIKGPCRVVYRRDNPKPCGARVWIETLFQVEVLTNNSTKLSLLR
ncbi:MAG: helix-turn-helix domain-containing protein [Symploca sp. SIO3C6]|uniref:Helix-turn-helix domain-containing protein n=1 Tax=Symploca sp. SIO1C4 TaxID=2607765 RepID=A0A6B3NC77_9CYAN|nr:helix-turn-helix domain-containing protein [Symploca sp. SIO3C6]NER28202.1 helix-turn-helix domain-containing protein [Symploca sp. SIO1C4]NET03213.1 helix-turn-helix domain-containing protein [Symploca sp. SIO2B6]NET54343.1 helix-turn-helix domain-containing protein [Merismopedia sp. SIO2A8]